MFTNDQIALVKGLLAQGHKQHDIAAHFAVSPGRVSDVALGKVGAEIKASRGLLPNVRPMRYFMPNMLLDEQIAILDDLIATAPSDSARIYTITPALASHIITTRNARNRKPSSKKVSEYVEAMRKKRWPVTGATIVFSKSGWLMDGQHRLMAAIQSKTAISTFVAFNIDDGAFAMIDIGRRRSNTDAFQIAEVDEPGITAKAVRWVMLHQKNPLDRSTVFTNDQLFSWYEKNIDQKLMADCVLLAHQADHQSRKLATGKARNYLPAGCVAAYLYIFAHVSKKAMLEFAEQLITQHGHGRSLTRNLKDRMDNNAGRINEVVRNALIVQAWVAFRSGSRPSKSHFTWTLSEPFPSIT
jgi:hypothetical protein